MSTQHHMVSVLMEHGTSRSDATLVFDVALHAMREAVNTMIRITDTAPEHLQKTALISALTLLEAQIRVTRQEFTGKQD